MKKTAKIGEERFSRMKQVVLTLELAALLCTPYLTNTSYAQGHGTMIGSYQGMAYLAEQEIRTEELQARAAEEAKLVADAEVTDEDSTENEK